MKNIAYKISLCSLMLFLHIGPSSAQENLVDLTSSETITEEESAPSIKRKVAIARFSNETRTGATFLIDDSGNRIGKQAADILSTRLAETGKFLLFERIDQNEIDAEKLLAGMDEEGVSVEYLIVGSISEFGRSTESQSGIFQRTRIQRAFCKVNVRLIEVSTGRIIFATEGAGEATSEAKTTLGVGSRAGYDDSLTDRAISAAVSQVTSNLVENMTNKPWKSFLLAESGENFIIAGGGSQGIETGMNLYLYRNGEIVNNPQTGISITLPGSKAGILTVLESFGEDEFNEVSIVSLESGEIDQPLDNYYIQEE